MEAINKVDSIEKVRSDNGELLSRFNDEKTKRNARRVVEDCDKDGLCEQSMMFVFELAKVTIVRKTAPDFGKDDDDDDDSIDLFPATATPSKQKRRISDEEGQTDLLENCNKISLELPSLACLRKEPNAEVKSVAWLRYFPVGLLARKRWLI